MTSAAEANAIVQAYLDVLDAIEREHLDSNVSVKLTGLGLDGLIGGHKVPLRFCVALELPRRKRTFRALRNLSAKLCSELLPLVSKLIQPRQLWLDTQ